MAYSLEWINENIRKNPERFIRECDERFYERVAEAADQISSNIGKSPIVLLAGPSGSGKTTTAKMIEEELERRGINSHTVSMDNYFKTLNTADCPRTADGEVDYESPLHLDMELLNEHFHMLAEGKEIKIPYFMFARQKRSFSQFTKMRLNDNEIAIFEGIHALNDMITEKNPEAFKLYISAAARTDENGKEVFKPEWTRLTRRVVRDNNFRGADAADTLARWGSVLAGEVKHITPFIEKADMQFESSLPYEIPVLKPYAVGLFETVPKDNGNYDELHDILSALGKYEEASESLVPETSLLREFIGGGIYEY